MGNFQKNHPRKILFNRHLENPTDSLSLKNSCSQGIENTVEVIDNPKPIFECKYFDNCDIRKFGRINCLTKDTIKTCRTYKFYEKYKDFDYGRQLGI